MGFLIAFLALFLLVLAGVSFAAVKLFAARDANGKVTAPGCLLGCATGLALAVLGVLGLGAFALAATAIVKLHAVDRLIRNAPDVEIGSWLDPERRVHRDPARPLHVVVQWPGHSEPTAEIVERVNDLLNTRSGLDARVRVNGVDVEPPPFAEAMPGYVPSPGELLVDVDYTHDENGEPITVVDIAIPLYGGPLEGLEQELDDLLNASGDGMRVRIRREDAGELR